RGAWAGLDGARRPWHRFGGRIRVGPSVSLSTEPSVLGGGVLCVADHVGVSIIPKSIVYSHRVYRSTICAAGAPHRGASAGPHWSVPSRVALDRSGAIAGRTAHRS